jgi:hypothetical protein
MRRTVGVAILFVVGAGFAIGCGGSGSANTLTCSYLASSDNCWETTAAAAPSCLPPPSEIGTLSADGSTCTYASGDVVTFTPPLVLPTTSSMAWNFTVTTSSGASCLSYVDNGNGGVTLTVQGQTVKETNPGGLSIALTCPDGTTLSNSNALSLLSCPDAGFLGGLPGASWSDTNTSVSLSLLANLPGAYGIPVFNCQM